MSVISKGAAQIFKAFQDAGAQAYLVGGTVRNHLWGLPITDRDFSVSCAPEETLRICQSNNLKTILTGIDHGTITIIAAGEPFEATSFRKDVETDGRHATTHFGGTLEEDAHRRDFTINALYLNGDGEILDPLGARTDIDSKTLRFVGDAHARIKEDYLRILRFFRFFSQYDLNADDEALEAIRANNTGIDNLSRERVGVEMRKLLGGKHFVEALTLAEKTGTHAYFSVNFDIGTCAKWREFETGNKLTPDWKTRLAVLGDDLPANAWRLSKKETQFIGEIRRAKGAGHTPESLGYLYGAPVAIGILEQRAFLGYPLPTNYQARSLEGAALTFPLSGKDLLPYMSSGKEMGAILSAVKSQWLYNNFALDHDALLTIALEEINKSQG